MQKRTIAYDMTQEEFDEVMDFEEIVQTKDDLLETEAAKQKVENQELKPQPSQAKERKALLRTKKVALAKVVLLSPFQLK